MTALYKEGRNPGDVQNDQRSQRPHPGGWTSQQTEVWSFLLLRVFLLSKRRWKNREYLSLFVIGYSSDGFKFIFFYNRLSSKKQ